MTAFGVYRITSAHLSFSYVVIPVRSIIPSARTDPCSLLLIQISSVVSIMTHLHIINTYFIVKLSIALCLLDIIT